MSEYQPSFHEWFVNLINIIDKVNNQEQLEKALKKALVGFDISEEVILCLPDLSSEKYLPILLKPSGAVTTLQQQTLAEAAKLADRDGFLPRIRSLEGATILQYRDDQKKRKVVAAPVWYGDASIGYLLFFCLSNSNRCEKELAFANSLALLVSAKLSLIRANETIALQKEEILLLKKQVVTAGPTTPEKGAAYKPDEMIGSGPSMRKISHMLSQVSTESSTVLILGETGTGKELIARAVHNLSARKDREMIKVNCANLPSNLIESELFGHEKGSFTGASERRIGKFELANNSTLFLDEVGEMPPELQVKLLRALQEGEIDRIGGKNTISVNVRLIAATNRDLMKEVQAGRFRSDLYFRLNVFPITLPPLRDRKGDIPLLARHFLQKYAGKLKKPVTRITSKAMKQLIAYNWPGNIRELEHIVERSVLLAKGKEVAHLPLPGSEEDENGIRLSNPHIKTLQDVERAHILFILKMTNGKISGVGGAAELLKIPATTLASKMRKLKIRREAF
jgi:formate hydrogenlyase transcriptional activator